MNYLSIIYLLLITLLHPSEILPLIKILKVRSSKLGCEDGRMEKCYDLLTLYSRSFSTVILLLNQELRDYICLLYLALRALDTVEDHPGLDADLRKRYLINFHSEMLSPDFSLEDLFSESKPEEYELIKNFNLVADLINGLPPALKDALIENVRAMGNGVANMQGGGCNTIEDYDNYAKYVAGYVGVALTKGFVITGSAPPDLMEDHNLELSIKVGNFLQKTNIIKDYRKDFLEGREFWPRCIVSIYLPPHETSYGALLEPKHKDRAFACLLHMVYDAITLLPHALKYYKMISRPDVVRFVLVPQAMAICTLAHLLKNNSVFKGSNLKIRSSLSAKLMTLTKPQDFSPIYIESLNQIHDVYKDNFSNEYFKLSYEACAACANALVSVYKYMSVSS